MRSLINLTKRVFQSRLASKYFRWPTARTLFIYACLAAFFTLTSTVEVVFRVTAHNGILRGLEALGANVAGCALLTLLILLMWGIYYRLLTGFILGVGAFLRGLPRAWYNFRSGLSRFVSALADFAGGVVNFLGSVRDFLVAVPGFFRALPANWRRKSGKQKADVVINLIILAIWTVCIVLIYPVAHHLSKASPHWMPMSDAPLLQTIFYDLVLGSFAMVGVCLTICLGALGLSHLSRGR